jgi:GT2 family glycosyltransferase
MKTVSVILPFFNNWQLTHQRMMELYSRVHTPIEIILVDDCSTDDVSGGMGWWKTQSKHRVICIKTPKNLGFGGAHNHGAKRATGEVLIFLSNDVVITGDFLPGVLGAVGEKVLVGNTLRGYDTGWNVLEINGKPKLFPYLEGYFLACTKDVWKELGGFDPLYAKFDYEDMCLSTTAIYKGYKLVPLNLDILQHMSGQTIRKNYPDREKYTFINQQRFINKWSKILKDE